MLVQGARLRERTYRHGDNGRHRLGWHRREPCYAITAYNVTTEEINKIVDILGDSIDEILQEHKA